MRARGGDLGDDGGTPDPTSATNWGLLDDYRDILEVIADGGDPRAKRYQGHVNAMINRVKH
jgi:hypothetical protein